MANEWIAIINGKHRFRIGAETQEDVAKYLKAADTEGGAVILPAKTDDIVGLEEGEVRPIQD